MRGLKVRQKVGIINKEAKEGSRASPSRLTRLPDADPCSLSLALARW